MAIQYSPAAKPVAVIYLSEPTDPEVDGFYLLSKKGWIVSERFERRSRADDALQERSTYAYQLGYQLGYEGRPQQGEDRLHRDGHWAGIEARVEHKKTLERSRAAVRELI